MLTLIRIISASVVFYIMTILMDIAKMVPHDRIPYYVAAFVAMVIFGVASSFIGESK